MRILIADDDKISRDLMRIFIEAEQRHTIVQASDGEEALRLLKDAPAGHVDLCILDVMMPRMDGLTLVEKIRQTESLKDMRIILCSAVSDRAKVQKAAQLGVGHYVVKPYVRQLIIEKIKLVESELSAKESLEDQEVVCERLGLDHETYQAMLQSFLEEVRNWVAFARTSDSAKEAESLGMSANGFRGSALSLGAVVLARQLADFETALTLPADDKARGNVNFSLNAIENEVKMVIERVKARQKPKA